MYFRKKSRRERIVKCERLMNADLRKSEGKDEEKEE